MNFPSIFNDVIGPIMRGPSSSHSAAALRIGRIASELMDGEIIEAKLRMDKNGSLAMTHTSQGSDLGLIGGFLGMETADERLLDASSLIQQSGIKFDWEIDDYGDLHPNTYHLSLSNSNECHTITAISFGGGMIEIVEIDEHPVSIFGDYYVTLMFMESDQSEQLMEIKNSLNIDQISINKNKEAYLLTIQSRKPIEESLLKKYIVSESTCFKQISPVLPILSRSDMQVPFSSPSEMLDFNTDKKLSLWELALIYESARGNISKEEVFEKMGHIVCILQTAIRQGVQGTQYEDRILGHQSGEFQSMMDKGQLLDGGMLNQMILNITALMEVKSAMGVIVACPTAGSCGGLPGAVIGAAMEMGLSHTEITRAMLAAGLIGVFIAKNATFAAEVGGCQAECGSGSGMAAAALISLANGTCQQAVDAASLSLQNILGMICDPVANRVEVPCLGKNVLAASNAFASANMILAGYDVVIPLDEVIETMDRVGKQIPAELRCTGLGGLSVTESSRIVERKLNKRGL